MCGLHRRGYVEATEDEEILQRQHAKREISKSVEKVSGMVHTSIAVGLGMENTIHISIMGIRERTSNVAVSLSENDVTWWS
jgi:hypothetical protein